MRITFTPAVAALSAAFLLAASSAQAQTPTDTKSAPIAAVRGGAYFPFNSEVKTAVGKTWYGGGLDYSFQQKPGISRSIISLDYIERNSGGSDVRLIPVTFGQFALQGASQGQSNNVRPYFGIGVGAYFVHQSVPNSQGIQTSNNTTTIGGYLSAGVDISTSLLLEARYHILPKVGGTNSSGLQVMGGFRF